jgi:hypothetical protein
MKLVAGADPKQFGYRLISAVGEGIESRE